MTTRLASTSAEQLAEAHIERKASHFQFCARPVLGTTIVTSVSTMAGLASVELS
jgi:hypothetical protein